MTFKPKCELSETQNLNSIFPNGQTLDDILHEKLLYYHEARDRIFQTPTSSKIQKLRQTSKEKKELKKMISSSIVNEFADDRAYAKVEINGESIMGLIDTGANITCLGRNALDFLEKCQLKLISLSSDVQTADGTKRTIKGFCKAQIKFQNEAKEISLFVAPDLDQPLYLGTNFIKMYNLAPKIFPPALISEVSSVNKDPKKHILTPLEQRQLEEIIDMFPRSDFGLGSTSLTEHVIDTGDSPPVRAKTYPHSPAIQKLIEDEVDRMLEMNVIEPSLSSWRSPITLVCKPGKNRLCLDSRKVNQVTKPLAYPIPNMDGLLSRLKDTTYISSIDLKDAFWQVPLSPDSREKTAFAVPGKPSALYHFKVMPFGLCNAPQRMMLLMDEVIPAEYKSNVFVYLDDLLIVSANLDHHLKLLKMVASRLKHANLTINVEKSKFCYKELKYLGFIVANGQLKPDPEKLTAIMNFPEPRTLKQARGFLGAAGWYRRFIPDFATKAVGMTDALRGKKKFMMTPEALNSFQALKEALTTEPVLVNADFEKTFFVQCDASDKGVGGVLFQKDNEGEEHPIMYYSKKMNPAQRNYTVSEKECLAVVLSLEKFRPFIEGYEFVVITDHSSLQWLMSTKDLSGRLARWSLKLQRYTFTIEHRKGSQNIVPDALSRNCLIEEIVLDEETAPSIDLEHPSFREEEYSDLIDFIQGNKDSLVDLIVSENYVYKKTGFSSGIPDDDLKTWKLWVPSVLRISLISSLHDPINKSHGGISKTLYRLRQRYYWPKMALDVKLYIGSCESCKSSKSSNMVLKPEMGKVIDVERPFQHLFVDFLGPYPRSKNGNTKIFICLDQLTKFCFIEPIRKSSAQITIDCLARKIFPIVGVPETLLSDRGAEFMSKAFGNFLEKLGTRHLRTPKHSPQANASERTNRSILDSIRAYISTDHTAWDENLTEIMSALRSSYHQTIKMSPYEALFGHPMIQHGSEYTLLRKLNALNHSDLHIIPKSDKLQILHDIIRQNISQAHDCSAEKYNLRTRNVRFNVGQEIFYRTFPQSDFQKKFNYKFAPKFRMGRILKVLGSQRYEVGNLQNKSLGIYHTKDLKQ